MRRQLRVTIPPSSEEEEKERKRVPSGVFTRVSEIAFFLLLFCVGALGRCLYDERQIIFEGRS